MQKTRKDRKQRQQKRSYRRIGLLAVLMFLVAAAAACSFIDFTGKDKETAGFIPVKNKMNIMIMGVDRRADDVGRSDTLMVATVDPEAKKAALLSIPRDTRVKIKGNGYDKVNHAYAFGGHELTQSTVENLLGMKMNYYVMIDIKAFERIIDAIGGIDINVEKRMYYEDPWDDDGGLVINLYPGQQHMDGQKAMQYVRYRDEEGDIGRIGRQQKFMRAVLDQLISPGTVMKLPAIIKEVNAAVETDMPLTEMLSLGKIMQEIRANGIESAMIPGKPVDIKDISYWQPDVKELRQNLALQLGVTFDDEMQAAAAATDSELSGTPAQPTIANGKNAATDEAKAAKRAAKSPADITVRVVNSSGINGAGAKVAAELQQKGFTVSAVETGPTASATKTTVTAAAGETSHFYGMSFACTIMEGAEHGKATVNIGQDYRK